MTSSVPYPAPVQPGDVLRGKYRVERLLGQGGMAYVISAWHLHLEQRVAIKLLRPETVEHPEVVARFLREARAVSRLESSHVARVLDVDTLDSGPPFIVMEYLEGRDLSQVLRARGPVPAGEVAAWVREACQGVAEAHALGVIHRDLKPANLFLAQKRSGEAIVKVLDFGISKLLEDTRLTMNEVGMGSAEYMSPEQMTSAADVDVRCDVWSLGVTLYELTTGTTPFRADGVGQVAVAVMTRDPAPPRTHRPEIPAGFEAVVLRCLDKDPARRHATVLELSAALAPFAVALPAAAAPQASRAAVPVRTLQSAAYPDPPPGPTRIPVVEIVGPPPVPPSTMGGDSPFPPPQASAVPATVPATMPDPPLARPPAPAPKKTSAELGVVAGVIIAVVAIAIVVAAFVLGRQGGSSATAASGVNRYTLDATTLRDTQTGLVWQRVPAPRAMDWETAKEYCARQKGPLRLPEIEELAGLVAVTQTQPPVDAVNFPTTPADVFWAATAAGRGGASVVHFSTGRRGTSVISAVNRVRCVR